MCSCQVSIREVHLIAMVFQCPSMCLVSGWLVYSPVLQLGVVMSHWDLV